MISDKDRGLVEVLMEVETFSIISADIILMSIKIFAFEAVESISMVSLQN